MRSSPGRLPWPVATALATAARSRSTASSNASEWKDRCSAPGRRQLEPGRARLRRRLAPLTARCSPGPCHSALCPPAPHRQQRARSRAMRLLNASGCLDALTAPDVAAGLDTFVTKTVTPLPRGGNDPVRIAETEVGMLNAIGLANPGIDAFLAHVLPRLPRPVWVSVGGFSVGDYTEICERLEGEDVGAIELNLSCPNIDEAPSGVGEVVAAARAATT